MIMAFRDIKQLVMAIRLKKREQSPDNEAFLKEVEADLAGGKAFFDYKRASRVLAMYRKAYQ